MTVRFVKRAILALLLFSVVFMPVSVFAQGDAAGAIASARQQIVVCYDLAREAEAAGANISSLTSALNAVGSLLSQSELAYSKGDFVSAEGLASQCVQRLSGLISDSNVLRNGAVGARDFNFLVSVGVSVVATFVVIVLGFGAWRYLAKRYLPVEVETDKPSEL